jgi:hypothetical protein
MRRPGSPLPAALGPHDIWWSYQAASEQNGVPGTRALVHWDGEHWTAIAVPAAIVAIEDMTQDGHGGIWLIAATAGSPDSGQRWFHYNDGRWSSQPVPAPKGYNDALFGMAWIPHTRSLCAVGEADLNNGNGSVGIIARYGP